MSQWYAWALTLYSLARVSAFCFAGEVSDGHGGAHFSAVPDGFEADAAEVGGPGYHDDPALQAQEVGQSVGFGN